MVGGPDLPEILRGGILSGLILIYAVHPCSRLDLSIQRLEKPDSSQAFM